MEIINVLHRHDFVGDYGFKGSSKVVVADTGTYWVKDYYCGEGSLEGGCLRPFVYKLSDREFSALDAVWDSAKGEYSRDKIASYFTEPTGCSVEEYLTHIHNVNFAGSLRASRLPWALSLVDA